jgi:hypothetical protein
MTYFLLFYYMPRNKSELLILSGLSECALMHTAPSADLTSSSEDSDLELAVLSWFEDRGICQTNPEDVIREHHSSLRLALRVNVRKLSAPDEGSALGRRRVRENMAVDV